LEQRLRPMPLRLALLPLRLALPRQERRQQQARLLRLAVLRQQRLAARSLRRKRPLTFP